jgi:hypothetical protein
MSDIVARLAVHAWRSDGWTRADCAEAAAEIERLRAERDALRVALMPFAVAANPDLSPEMDDQWVDTSNYMLHDLTYGYFRKARILLSKDRA